MLLTLLAPQGAPGGILGDSSVALDSVTGASAGSVAIVGLSSQQLAEILQSSTGTVGSAAATGNSSATLGQVVQSAAGGVLVTGASAQQLAAATGSGTGSVLVAGVSAATLAAALGLAAGGVLVRADSARALEAILGAAAGVLGPAPRVGDSSITLAIVTGSATGTVVAGANDTEVAVFFDTAEFARTVTWGAYTAQAIFDAPDVDILGDAALSTDHAALMRASQLPGISRGETIACGGATYRVREVRLLDDGKLKLLSLTRVSGNPAGDSGFFAEDLSAFFLTPDFAVTATWGAQTGQVLLDTPTEDILSGRALSVEYTATCRDDQLVGIARGDTLTIVGVAYRVRDVRATGAGRIKILTLTKI